MLLVSKKILCIMMDDIVTTDIIHIFKNANELYYRCPMIDGIIMPECSYIMYLVVFPSNFNINYGIFRRIVCIIIMLTDEVD